MNKNLTNTAYSLGIRSIYLWLPILVFGLNKLASLNSLWVDRIYGRGIFVGLRYVYDYTFGWLPFGMVYLLFGLLVYLIFIYFRRLGAEWRSVGLLKMALIPVLKFFSVVYCLFYILWGFNYQATDLKEKLSLEKIAVDSFYLKKEVKYSVLEMMRLRDQINLQAGATILEANLPEDMEANIRVAQKKLLQSWDIPNGARVRVRKLKPAGTLLRIATAGVYIPFAMEGHIDAGLHPIQWPATMAHEMAHGYGLTDEGVCNFVGFVSCLQSDDPAIKYSGWMMYLRYLLSNGRKIKIKEWGVALPEEIKVDLRAIHTEQNKYPDIFPEARDAIYDQYLKSHGVEGGLVSYSTIIQMVADWKVSAHNKELHWE